AGLCFFFQAEDGIRDFHVTGVQTCALPIYARGPLALALARAGVRARDHRGGAEAWRRARSRPADRARPGADAATRDLVDARAGRSEERRVGKEWRARRAAAQRIQQADGVDR